MTTLSIASAAQPSWSTKGACISPGGTLCRTLVYESSGWANRSWGFHAIERHTDRTTEAVRSDGAAVLRIAHRSFKFFFIRADSYDRCRLILPKDRRTFEMEHTLNEVRDMGGLWSISEGWTDQPDCQLRALSAGKMAGKTGRLPILAGISAIEYIYETPDVPWVQRIAFAPSLGCTAIEYMLVKRNAAGLPVSEDKLRLVSAIIGEPDSKLFAVPSEYRVVSRDAPWPYLSMNGFPGNIWTTAFSTPVP